MTLTAIAADLMHGANTGGVAKHRLARGLVLSLQRNGRQWTLTAGRPDVAPSPTELNVIADAFKVPPGTDPIAGTVKGTKQGTRRTTWHIATWNWLEDMPVVQPALIPISARYE